MSTTPPAGATGNSKMRRELRLAPIMTGGTSLAVWIGGVTAELYDVVNRDLSEPAADDDVYGKLLELTETDAKVDIISGTSAGGLNGTMLAVAWATNAQTRDVRGLRETWMQLGDIDALLRTPSERNPPSLLKGDAYFWPHLRDVLTTLAGAGPGREARPATREITLLTTVTTLVGEPTLRQDHFGQDLHETRHAHSLTFTRKHIAGDPDWASRMALAARSSASIPGVFEASFLPITEEVKERPSFDDQATFRSSRWVMDGGVLDNKPIGIALDEIFKQSADSALRRVILYVNPTPSGPVVAPPDESADVPSIREVLSAANKAPKNEEIQRDLDRLRDANRAADRAVDVRASLGDLVEKLHFMVMDAARAVLPRFREIRNRSSVQTHLDHYAAAEVKSTKDRAALEKDLIPAGDAWLPEQDLDLPDAIVGADGWIWGIAPLEYVAAMLFDLVARAFQLPRDANADREALGRCRKRIGAQVEGLFLVRLADHDYWAKEFAAATDPDKSHPEDWATEAYRNWPEDLRRDLGRIADALGSLALQVCVAIQELPPAGSHDLAFLHANLELLKEAVPATLTRDPAGPEGVSADQVKPMVARLVGVHVLATTMGDTARRPQRIEFLEVSFRARNTLDKCRQPEEKLAGQEFNRLGAFVKASWRANDWMWGRLDGAYQLVLVLLDPARLLQLRLHPDKVVEDLGLRDPLDPQVEADARAELAWLLREESRIPLSLPRCAEILAGRIQARIVRDELPNVKQAVLASNEAGGAEGDHGAFRFAVEDAGPAELWTEKTCSTLLAKCRIGTERQADEVGRDALTRTGGRVIAVAGNAVTGDKSGLGLPARIAAPIRQLALVVYALSRLATTQSRTALALSAVVFGSAAAVIAMDLLGTDVNAGFVVLAWMVIIVGALLTILRSGVWSLFPALLALLVIALALIGTDLRPAITTAPGIDRHATMEKGDTLDVRGSVVFTPKTVDADGDDQGPIRVGRGSTGEVARGRVEVHRVTSDQSWKKTYVLQSVSVAAIVIALAMLVWLGGLVGQRQRALRRAKKAAEQVAKRQPGTEASETTSVPNLLPPIVIALAVVIGQHRLFHLIFTGQDTGARAWFADAAESMAKHDVIIVVVAVVFIGIFVGLAWDRGVRPIVSALVSGAKKVASWPGGVRWFLGIVVGVICIVLAVLLHLKSDDLAQGGQSYNDFQTAGTNIGTAIDLWSSQLRQTAAATALLDTGFALSYGFFGLVLFASLAKVAHNRARDRADLRARLYNFAAWSIVFAAAADVLENIGLLVSLALFGVNADTAGLGVAVALIGGIKWALVALTAVAVALALLSMLPGHHKKTVKVMVRPDGAAPTLPVPAPA